MAAVPTAVRIPALALIGAGGEVEQSTEGLRRQYEDKAELCTHSPELERVLSGEANHAVVTLDGVTAEIEAVVDSAGTRHALLTLAPDAAVPVGDARNALLGESVDGSPAMVWLKDLEGRYLHVNRRYTEFLGTSVDRVRGRTDGELAPRETVDGPRLQERGAQRRETVQLEYTVPAFEGRPTLAALRFAVRDREGNAIAVCGVAAPVDDARLARDVAARLMEIERWSSLDLATVRAEVLREWGVALGGGDQAEAAIPASQHDRVLPSPDSPPDQAIAVRREQEIANERARAEELERALAQMQEQLADLRSARVVDHADEQARAEAEEAHADAEAARAEADAARREAAEALLHTERLETDAQKSRELAEQAEADAHGLRARLEQAEADAQQSRARAERAEAAAHGLGARLEQADAHAQQSRARMGQSEAEVERLRARAEEAGAEVEQARARAERAEAAAQGLAARLEQADADAQQSRARAGQAEAEVERLCARVEDAETEAQQLRQRVEQAQANAQQLSERLVDGEADLERLSARTEQADAALAAAIAERDSALAANAALTRELEEERRLVATRHDASARATEDAHKLVSALIAEREGTDELLRSLRQTGERLPQLYQPDSSAGPRWLAGARRMLVASLAGAPDWQTGLTRAVKILGSQGGWDAAAAWSAEPGALRCAAIWTAHPGLSAFETTTRQAPQIRVGSLLGHALQAPHVTWLTDIDEMNDERISAAATHGIRTAVLLPIRDGVATVGLLELLTRARSEPDAQMAISLEAAALQIGRFGWLLTLGGRSAS